jgi:hypothetical protein
VRIPPSLAEGSIPGVLAGLARVEGCRRAGAGLRSGHIVGIALIVLDQHHICGEPVECGHFRRFLAVVLVGYQLLYGCRGLSDRAG